MRVWVSRQSSHCFDFISFNSPLQEGTVTAGATAGLWAAQVAAAFTAAVDAKHLHGSGRGRRADGHTQHLCQVVGTMTRACA